jgi:hypothetical protein
MPTNRDRESGAFLNNPTDASATASTQDLPIGDGCGS